MNTAPASSPSENPPLLADRKRCYDARDRFWKCLDDNKGLEIPCQELRKIYEAACPGRWVDHFDRKYRFEKFKTQEEQKLVASK
uniref:Cytochrome c oxidase assembly factor 6 homolog n=1 Tax=Romanomermis culicivorax TaxID=13658 RepID=A0A915HN35_ROMCU